MLAQKKDIEIKPSTPGGNYTLYKKDESVLAPIYTQLAPGNKSLVIQIGVYDQAGTLHAQLQAGQLHVNGEQLIINGQTVEDASGSEAFDNLFPVITKQGLDLIKKMEFNGGTLGDYLK